MYILIYFYFFKYIDPYSALNSPPIPHKNNSKKKTKSSRVLDKSQALVITEKSCYIACINACYGNPSLDPSRPDLPRLDCLAADRRLPCSLCLLRRGDGDGSSLVFPSSPLPAGSAALSILSTPRDVQELTVPKKDKLKKKEREVAEKHLLNFGESIRQIERCSSSHKYRPRSSYFPSRIMSSILDSLLDIHSPFELEDILNDSWAYYSSHGTSLLNIIIDIQTSIKVQRNSARQTTTAKQREKRQTTRLGLEAIGDAVDLDPLLSEVGPAELPEQTLNESESPRRKRQALEQITNTTKRRRAPRTVQPSVAQVLESFRPQYSTRRRNAFVAESPSQAKGNHGKENERRMVS